jgi:hypothetical protein
MTHEQIIGSIFIGLVVLVIGEVSKPLFKALWRRMNTPGPLTPQSKAQSVFNRAMWEQYLERLKYFSTNTKELFLYLVQLIFAAFLVIICAALLYTLKVLVAHPPYVSLFSLSIFLLLILAGGFCVTGILEANKVSDKKLSQNIKSAQKHIDDIDKLLNPSQEDPNS